MLLTSYRVCILKQVGDRRQSQSRPISPIHTAENGLDSRDTLTTQTGYPMAANIEFNGEGDVSGEVLTMPRVNRLGLSELYSLPEGTKDVAQYFCPDSHIRLVTNFLQASSSSTISLATPKRLGLGLGIRR